jgi:hypothetical protein
VRCVERFDDCVAMPFLLSTADNDESNNRRTARGNIDRALRVTLNAAAARKVSQADYVTTGWRVLGDKDTGISSDGTAYSCRLNGHGEDHLFHAGSSARDADGHSTRRRLHFRSALGARRGAQEEVRPQAQDEGPTSGLHEVDMIMWIP